MPKTKFLITFVIGCKKSKLLVLCLKAVFGCPKPAFGCTKPVKISFWHFWAAFVSQKSGFVHLKDSFVYKIKNLLFGIQSQKLSKSWFWTRFRRLLYTKKWSFTWWFLTSSFFRFLSRVWTTTTTCPCSSTAFVRRSTLTYFLRHTESKTCSQREDQRRFYQSYRS